MERKVRYKLHKRRKQWVKIAVVVLGGFILSVSVGEEASASSEIEQTQDPTSQVSQIIEPEEVPISTESTIETDTVEPQAVSIEGSKETIESTGSSVDTTKTLDTTSLVVKDETELTGNQVESTTEGIGVEQSSISESPIETTGEIEAISEESSAITASDSQVETPVKTPVESTDFSIVDKENETVIDYTNDQKSHNVLVSANIKTGDRLEVVTPWIFNAMSDDVMGMEKNKVVVDVSEQTITERTEGNTVFTYLADKNGFVQFNVTLLSRWTEISADILSDNSIYPVTLKVNDITQSVLNYTVENKTEINYSKLAINETPTKLITDQAYSFSIDLVHNQVSRSDSVFAKTSFELEVPEGFELINGTVDSATNPGIFHLRTVDSRGFSQPNGAGTPIVITASYFFNQPGESLTGFDTYEYTFWGKYTQPLTKEKNIFSVTDGEARLVLSDYQAISSNKFYGTTPISKEVGVSNEASKFSEISLVDSSKETIYRDYFTESGKKLSETGEYSFPPSTSGTMTVTAANIGNVTQTNVKITYEIEPGTEAINDDYGNGYYYEFSKNDFNPFDISIVYADGTQTSYTTDKLMNGRLYLPEGKDGSDTVKVIASADELFAGNSLEFKYGTYRLLDTLKPVSTANYTVHFESDLIQKDSSKTLKVSDPEKIPLSSSIFGSMIFSKEIYRPGEEFTNNFFLTTNYAANLGVYYFIMPEGMDYTDIAWSPDPVSDLSDLPDIHNYLTDLGYVGENGEKVLKVDLSSLYSDKFVANSMILYMNKISLTMKVNEDALPINKLLDARDVSFLAVTDTYPLLADEIPVYKQFGSEKIEGHSSRDRGRAIPYSIVLPSFVGVKNGIDDPMTEKQEFLAFDSSIPEETTAHFNSGKTFKTEDDLIDSHIRLTSINGMAGSLSTTQNILILPTIEAGDPFTMVLTGAGILSDNLSTDTSKVLYSSDIVTVDGNKIIDTSDFLTANQVTNWSTIRTVILSCEELNEGGYTSVILPVQVLNINQVEKDSEAMIKTDFLFNSAGKVLSTSSNLKAKVTVSDAVFTNGITIIDVKTNQSPIIIDNREQGSLVRSLNTMVLQNIDGTIDKTVDELLTHSIEQASLKFNQTVNLWSKVFLPTLQKITNQKPEFNDFSYAVAPEFIAQWNKDIVLDKQTYEKLPETFEIPLIAQNDQIALHYTDGDGHELAETDWFKREHNTPMMISDVTEKISNGTLQKIIVDINEGQSSNLLESKFESNHDTEFVFGDVIPEENGYVVYDLFDQTITTGHYSIDGTRVGGQTISIPTIVKEIKQLILESDTGGRYANLSDEQLTELIQRTYTNLLDLIYSPFLLHPEGFVTQQLTSVEEKLGLKLTISEYFPEEFAENPEAAFTEMEQVMKFRFSQLRNFVGLLNSYQVTYVYTTSLIDEGTKHYENTVTESEASKARAELEVLQAENEAKGIHTTVQLNVLPNEAPLVELATVLGEGTKHYENTVTESEASKARAELEALQAENEAKGIHTTVQLNVLPNEAPLVELATVLGEGTKHYENTVTESEASKARAELEALKAENEAKGIHTTVQLNVLPNEAPLVELATVLGEGTKHYENTVTESEASKARAELEVLKAENEAKGIHTTVQLNVLPNEAPSKITVIPEKPTKQKETTSVSEPVKNTVTLKKDNLVLLVAPEKGDSMAIKDVIVPMQNTTNGASKLPQTGETKSATGFITGLGILLTFGSALIFKKKHE